jgi:hypothetical protein
MKTYLFNIAASPALWKGLVWLAMSMGFALNMPQQNAIIGAGLALQALIHAFEANTDAKS